MVEVLESYRPESNFYFNALFQKPNNKIYFDDAEVARPNGAVGFLQWYSELYFS